MRGRIRTIKPEVAKDEALWDVTQETGIPVNLAFIHLWCWADREGRFEWRPRALKVECLPYWDGDFSRVLDALATRGFVFPYTVQGRKYGVIVTFKKHQAINGKEEPSRLPPPPDDFAEQALKASVSHVEHTSSTCEARVEDVSIRSATRHGRVTAPNLVPVPFPSGGDPGGGNGDDSPAPDEPKSKTRRAPKIRSRRIPDDWQPSDAHRELAKKLGVDIDEQLTEIRDHEYAQPKSDWDAAFRKWLRNADKWRGKGRPSSSTDYQPDPEFQRTIDEIWGDPEAAQ